MENEAKLPKHKEFAQKSFVFNLYSIVIKLMEYTLKNIENVLKDYFGYSSFRNGQDTAVMSILSGGHTLVVMPTGGGKSLCYQLPAIMADGLVLVISPLIALMKDQVDALNKIGIPATFINSSIPAQEIRNRLVGIAENKYKLAYVAPERLKNKQFVEFLKQIKLAFLAVDEAHCISEWGHDFRPAYLSISKIFEEIPHIPVIALTATATPEVREDIIESLNMDGAERIIKGFDRPNLSYKTEICENKLDRICEICSEQTEGSIVIYCGSRKRVDSISQGLKDKGVYNSAYHAGMTVEHRRIVQDKFIGGKERVIVATNAFGMGIDKSDVRKVIHADLTQTLESYYQEAGRAGRDGRPSECIMLFYPTDRRLQEFFINSTFPSVGDINRIYNTLYDINSVALGQRSEKPVLLDSAQIANRAGMPALIANSVLSLLERYEIIRKGSAHITARIKFTTSKERMIEYFNHSEGEKRDILEALLRSISSEAFNDMVEFDLNSFLLKYNLSMDGFRKYARSFINSRMMILEMPGAAGGYNLLLERMRPESLPIDYDALLERRSNAIEKLNMVQRYAETKKCKRNYILEYFGEPVPGKCGQCSSCTGSKNKDKAASTKQAFLNAQILKSVYEINSKFGKTIMTDFIKGIKTAKIRHYKLNKARYFASCSDFSARDIRYGIDNAITQGVLSLTSGDFPKLFITELGLEELKHKPDKQFKVNLGRDENLDQNKVYEVLKALRNDIALRNKIQPRAVISDKAMREMAVALPGNIGEISAIAGVGGMFMASYGEEFLAKINEIIALNKQSKNGVKIPEHIKSALQLMESGNSLQNASGFVGHTAGAIAMDIQRLIESGMPYNKGIFFTREEYSKVYNFIRKAPGAPLREVREKSGIKMEYPNLRIAVCIARKELIENGG